MSSAKRAAAVLGAAIALKFREATLVPELHGQANDGAAFLLQNRGDRRGVHPAGHGHRDQTGLRRRFYGQRLELCGARHIELLV
jgi:hypothetical protein